MVRERDGRIKFLQKELLDLAAMKDGGGRGGLSNGNNGEHVGILKNPKGDAAELQPVKTVKIMSKKQKALSILYREFTALQAGHTEQCQELCNQIVELREMRRASAGGGGSRLGPVASIQGLSQNALVHRCSALEGKVRRLEDEIHEVEVQGGVRALVEAQELIDALQSEVRIDKNGTKEQSDDTSVLLPLIHPLPRLQLASLVSVALLTPQSFLARRRHSWPRPTGRTGC